MKKSKLDVVFSDSSDDKECVSTTSDGVDKFTLLAFQLVDPQCKFCLCNNVLFSVHASVTITMYVAFQ
jgi:hypothetical protein